MKPIFKFMSFLNASAKVAAAAKSVPQGYSWMERFKAVPRMVKDVLFHGWRSGNLNRGTVVLSLLGFIYAVSPLDFIPELFLGPFGLTDDVAIATVSLVFLAKGADAWLSNQVEAATDVVQGVVVNSETVN